LIAQVEQLKFSAFLLEKAQIPISALKKAQIPISA
jgi:hypothetical protein